MRGLKVDISTFTWLKSEEFLDMLSGSIHGEHLVTSSGTAQGRSAGANSQQRPLGYYGDRGWAGPSPLRPRLCPGHFERSNRDSPFLSLSRPVRLRGRFDWRGTGGRVPLGYHLLTGRAGKCTGAVRGVKLPAQRGSTWLALELVVPCPVHNSSHL